MTIQPELQAVVLAAGKGSRMLEITSRKPKCLLPVGPKPLIWYTLNNLQVSGFTEAIVIVLETQRAEIQNHLENTDLNLKIEFVSIPEDRDDLGTADSLRLIHDRLKSDVLVLSCDLISDENLSGLLNIFRKHNASIASLFLHSDPLGTLMVPGPKSKYKAERDLVGIDVQTNRLVFLASASDFESDVSLPLKLLKKHTHVKMYSNLVDSHIYVIKNWVIQHLKLEDSFTSLKGELIPYIVKRQLSKPPKTTDTNQSILNTKDTGSIFHFSEESDLDLLIRETSSYNDHFGDLKPTYNGDSIRCYAYVAPKASFGIRVNNLPAYWSINGKISNLWEKITPTKDLIRKSAGASVQSNQVDDKCIIWDGAKLKEKTSFKNAIIGNNTEVESFSRVFNSIIMNNVTIKEKVAIENSIICDGAVIESGCKIKNCIIGCGHLLNENSEHINEVLTETLMHF
ncbi:translation initiation factor eIF-2B subunit gamma [Cylas formicarius]|uniref:translation initiation factor eIF-2B subunit gamma n=1 Tax=Cylas formicarius TaxID=197179 RepID=UPI002958B025|nr:translation initiation factor eIF-2B subunit gamma [Cylas formicarius]